MKTQTKTADSAGSVQRLVRTQAKRRVLTLISKIQALQEIESASPYSLPLPSNMEGWKQELMNSYTELES